MYETYYHLSEKPFRLTADPKYLFESQSHSKAVALLRDAIVAREAFAVVTGDVGTGKTTLCRALADGGDRATFTALLPSPFISEDDLLTKVLRDFGVLSAGDERGDSARLGRQQMLSALHDFLGSLQTLGATAVLIADEAQALPIATLEQIRLLCNLMPEKETVLQVVLVGQLDLSSVLHTPELRLLDERFSIRYRLTPLTEDETSAYIAHRLAVAGSGTVTFTSSALQAAHEYSGGIPRLINLLAHRALLSGYAAQTSRIDGDLVRSAADGLELKKGAADAAPVRRSWFGRFRKGAGYSNSSSDA
jgi:general secretion pathway protein A